MEVAQNIPRRSKKFLKEWIDTNLYRRTRPQKTATLQPKSRILHSPSDDSGYASLANSPPSILLGPLRFESCSKSPTGSIAWPFDWEPMETESVVQTIPLLKVSSPASSIEEPVGLDSISSEITTAQVAAERTPDQV